MNSHRSRQASSWRRKTFVFNLFTGIILLLAIGCEEEQASSYEVPQLAETVPPAAVEITDASELPEGHPPVAGLEMGGSMEGMGGSMDMSTATLPEELIGRGELPAWTLPEGWTVGPLKPMRKATVLAGESGLEVAVTTFPGDVGGMTANVTRWRGQLGLRPIPTDELPNFVTPIEVSGREFYVVDLLGAAGTDGAPQQRMLATVASEGDSTWFFKLTGPAPVVEQVKHEYDAFVDSIRFQSQGEE